MISTHYSSYNGDEKLRQLVAEIPWGHNLVILIHKPIGVAQYKLTRKLPKKFRDSLPTIKEYEIVEMLLALGIPRKDCKQQAKEAIKKFSKIEL